MTPVEGRIELNGRIDQGQVDEGWREVAELFAAQADFLRIESEVVGVGEHLFAHVAILFSPGWEGTTRRKGGTRSVAPSSDTRLATMIYRTRFTPYP